MNSLSLIISATSWYCATAPTGLSIKNIGKHPFYWDIVRWRTIRWPVVLWGYESMTYLKGGVQAAWAKHSNQKDSNGFPASSSFAVPWLSKWQWKWQLSTNDFLLICSSYETHQQLRSMVLVRLRLVNVWWKAVHCGTYNVHIYRIFDYPNRPIEVISSSYPRKTL